MPDELDNFVTQSKAAGYTVKPANTETGVALVQIFDKAGEYIVSGVNERQAFWRMVRRGLGDQTVIGGRKAVRPIAHTGVKNG